MREHANAIFHDSPGHIWCNGCSLCCGIARLAERFGDRLVFHGGIDTQHLLPFGTPTEVKKAVRHCVEVLGNRNRYVIAPSQEIMNDVPIENIMALKEGIGDFRGLGSKTR